MSRLRIRQRGKSFSFAYEMGKDDNGKRRVKEKGGFTTKEAAFEAGVKDYNEYLQRNKTPLDKRPFGEYIAKWEQHSKVNISATSFDTYKTYLQHHIIPKFAKMPLSDITTNVVNGWVLDLYNIGLSRNSIQLAKSILSNIFNYTMSVSDVIKYNPLVGVSIPRNAPHKIIKRTVLTDQQISDYLDRYLWWDARRIFFLIAYHTGMRISEILGLCWENIDMDTHTIHVVEQRTRVRNIGYCFRPPKTSESKRDVLFGAELSTELSLWRSCQLANEANLEDAYLYVYANGEDNMKCKTFSKAFHPTQGMIRKNLVCTKSDGSAISGGSIRLALQTIDTNSHSIRHTHATKLIENGASVVSVAKRLGHSSVDTTLNIYTHDTLAMQKENIKIIEEKF